MKNGMTLEQLLTEVQRQNTQKQDYVATTKDDVRMVPGMAGIDNTETPKIVLLKHGSEQLQRLEISENAHRQIATTLTIPWKFYGRLLNDHPDMVIDAVNKLFEREPNTRLIRTLDGTVRAFLSDRYKRLDNAQVLEQSLPGIIQGQMETTLLSTNVSDDYMHMKVLFTDDRLAVDLGPSPAGRGNGWMDGAADVDAQHNVIARRDAGRDIVRPYAMIRNSEVGKGSLEVSCGFFRSFCLNGCMFGDTEAFNFRRTHVGGKLTESQNFEVFTDATKRKEDELIVAQVTDALTKIASPDTATLMAKSLKAAMDTERAVQPVAAVEAMAKEIGVLENEKNSMLEAFLRDGDFTKWGMVNAVTEVANKQTVSYDRAQELEAIGGKVLQMPVAQWHKFAIAEAVAA